MHRIWTRKVIQLKYIRRNKDKKIKQLSYSLFLSLDVTQFSFFLVAAIIEIVLLPNTI